MRSPHRKPLSRPLALTLAWSGMVLTLLLVVAFVAWVNARVEGPVGPQSMRGAPGRGMAESSSQPDRDSVQLSERQGARVPQPDALFDAAHMERLLLQPILKGEKR